MKIHQIITENTIFEGINHPALKGWEEMNAFKKGRALYRAGLLGADFGGYSSEELDDILQNAKLRSQEREHELTLSVEERKELQRKADEIKEIKRQQLRKERLQDEELAYKRAKDKADRQAEMEKIRRKYEQELTIIDKEHRNNMEAIRTGNTHEIDKMEREHRHEKEMFDKEAREKDKDRLERERERQEKQRKEQERQRSQEQPSQAPGSRGPAGPARWHTSQQVGYTPTKPQKPSKDDSDVIDVIARPVKNRNKPNVPRLALTKEGLERLTLLAGIKK